MPEPTTLGENQTKAMIRIREILAQRGIDPDAAPADNEPDPDDPSDPDYRRRKRTEFNLGRWKTATPERYWQAEATHPDVIAWTDRCITDLKNAGALLLFGSVGTGKTHQAYGALHRIAKAGIPDFELIAITAAEMHGELRVHPGDPDHDIELQIRRYCRVPLLFLDDIDVFKESETTEQNMFRIFNKRYNSQLPTIMTSNLLIRDTHGGRDLAGVLGERILSRLAQDATIVPISGTDLRREYR